MPCACARVKSLRKCVAVRGCRWHRVWLGTVAMDVGADEFEQNLPLLQELVLGADFVGMVPEILVPALSPMQA